MRAASVAAGLAGAEILQRSDEGAPGVTEPGPDTSKGLAAAQRAEQWLQSSNPVLTGVLIVLSAQQGEQQRPVAGWLGNRTAQVKKAVGR